MQRVRWSSLIALLIASRSLIAQQPVSSTFQQKIATAFSNGGGLPTQVSLIASAVYTAGSLSKDGTIQLQSSADGSTSEVWSFNSLGRTYVQGPLGLERTCTYTDQAKPSIQIFGTNCVQGLPWFFPSFALETSYASAVSVSDVTDASDTAQGLETLSYTLVVPQPATTTPNSADPLSRLQKATVVKVRYDVQTGLPAELVYHQAFDGDELRNIEVSVKFSSYTNESGFMIPHHIQKYVQRTLQLDLNITSATIH